MAKFNAKYCVEKSTQPFRPKQCTSATVTGGRDTSRLVNDYTIMYKALIQDYSSANWCILHC